MNTAVADLTMTQDQFEETIRSLIRGGRYAKAACMIREAERANVNYMGLDPGSFLFGWLCGDMVSGCIGRQRGCCGCCCCIGTCLCIGSVASG